MGDSEFRSKGGYKPKLAHLNNYFDHIEAELGWLKEKGNVKPSAEFFEGEEREKLLAAQAKGEPVQVRVMLTHKKEIDETFDRIIALEDEEIKNSRTKGD